MFKRRTVPFLPGSFLTPGAGQSDSPQVTGRQAGLADCSPQEPSLGESLPSNLCCHRYMGRTALKNGSNVLEEISSNIKGKFIRRAEREGLVITLLCLFPSCRLQYSCYKIPSIIVFHFLWPVHLCSSIHIVQSIKQTSKGRTELTCDESIRSWLFFPPCWHKHCNILMASFQKPVYCQFDPSTRKYFFIPVAETHIKIPCYMTWLFCEHTRNTARHKSPRPASCFPPAPGFLKVTGGQSEPCPNVAITCKMVWQRDNESAEYF